MLESRQAQNSIIPDVGSSGDGDDDAKMAMGEKGFRKAKQVMVYPFRVAKKHILRRRVKRPFSISSSGRTDCSDKRGFDGSVKHRGCGFCLPKLSISDSANGSPTDPNHRKFTEEMLRVLIQNNDFYSKQSNPHLGV